MTQENHDSIMQAIGRLEAGQGFLIEDAKKKNGYIRDLTDKTLKNTSDIDQIKGAGKAVNILWGIAVVLVGWAMWYLKG
jgi:hypothetical protein